MFDVLFVFIFKFLDCALATFKSVLFYRQHYILSALMAALSSLMYLVAVVKIVTVTNNTYSLLAVVVGTFLGSWLPPLIHDKLQKDRLLIFEITSDTFENGKQFADFLRANDIPVRTNKTYNKYQQKTLAITAYSESREVSKLIVNNLPKEFKWVTYCPYN